MLSFCSLTTAARAMSAHLKGLKRHFVFLFMLVVIGIQLLASALGITKSVRKEYYDGLDRLVNGKVRMNFVCELYADISNFTCPTHCVS